MYKAAIIADDFSSVTDCGVQFAKRGLSTIAMAEMPKGKFPCCEVLSVDTDSRPLHKEAAYQKAMGASLYLKRIGCERIYKSVDSTLRGNLGADIDGVMDGFSYPIALVAPAFPYYGRTTVDGVHYLNGIPLSKSPVSLDPTCPALKSDLVRVLDGQSKRKVAHIPLVQVREPSVIFQTKIRQLAAQGIGLVVLDVESEQDLETIAAHSANLPDCLVVGSTGLSQYIASAWGIARSKAYAPFPKAEGPVITVAASVSPVTKQQVELLILQPGTHALCMPCWQLVDGGWQQYEEEANAALRTGKDLVLYLDSTPESRAILDKKAMQHGWDKVRLAAEIAGAMGNLVGAVASGGIPGGIVATGGDAAKAVCRALGNDGMELLGEVEPGIPAGRFTSGRRLLVVTKAGAFGTPQALCVSRNFLKGVDHEYL
ncbi:four-carbon acid sugar kinase family protein [Desulfosporosinus sp. BICA1-9]|uniref:four-carbon acid sugar kinase family protein n=1 Tax=Desulfosporosinus sp. BICA1-9 TaxID=1531958 RepID=UPI00054BA1F6|nr:four-carbon acid sugar kinase family protein [Desulfosporosinus sp. BICA1-9]KJS50832.1 MAG: hypothetical protein VR66_00650 [Peptococcaceae bacterium BRH_c23]KJS83444.1 MAG: hypothetical protein JL57_22695 [Desulfosporosinus sp. BICA1-9]HBW37374.1 four-carbon acid sugar kinase family protein [Desulfosporosinus sp.]